MSELAKSAAWFPARKVSPAEAAKVKAAMEAAQREALVAHAAHVQRSISPGQAARHLDAAAGRNAARARVTAALPKEPLNAKDAKAALQAARAEAAANLEKNAGLMDSARRGAAAVRGTASHAADRVRGASDYALSRMRALGKGPQAPHSDFAPMAQRTFHGTDPRGQHLGTVLPTVEALRGQHITPESLRDLHDRVTDVTGAFAPARGHTLASKGIDSFLERGSDGVERVTDAGRAYHDMSSKFLAQHAAAPGVLEQSWHQLYMPRGGHEGAMNAALRADVHGAAGAPTDYNPLLTWTPRSPEHATLLRRTESPRVSSLTDRAGRPISGDALRAAKQQAAKRHAAAVQQAPTRPAPAPRADLSERGLFGTIGGGSQGSTALDPGAFG